MRLDRLITLGLARHFASLHSAEKGIPVLMYHNISDASEIGVRPYYKVNTPVSRFAEHMRWLAESGHKGIALEDAIVMSDVGGVRAQKLVAITFDDGFRNFYTSAWPILNQLGFSATMYLPTAFIGNTTRQFRGQDCLTWNEVRELRSTGIRFGSHSVTHPVLYKQSWYDIAAELSQSKKAIEAELSETISSFSYPYAFPQEDREFKESFVSLVKQQGYSTCATTVVGRYNTKVQASLVERIPVNSDDDRELFLAKVHGNYDWVAFPQLALRRAKQLRHKQRTAGSSAASQGIH